MTEPAISSDTKIHRDSNRVVLHYFGPYSDRVLDAVLSVVDNDLDDLTYATKERIAMIVAEMSHNVYDYLAENNRPQDPIELKLRFVDNGVEVMSRAVADDKAVAKVKSRLSKFNAMTEVQLENYLEDYRAPKDTGAGLGLGLWTIVREAKRGASDASFVRAKKSRKSDQTFMELRALVA